MRIGFLIYEGFTALDVIGPYEVLHRIPGVEARFVAKEVGPVTNDSGQLTVVADALLTDLKAPDILMVGGGLAGTLAAARDPEILDWVRSGHETSRYTCSVCTGSLILGAAGLLGGLTATSHWAAKEMLEQMGATYTEQRFVQEGKIVTAAGVSAGIDMALFLTGELAGREVAESIQLGMEYDPQPPFDSGSVQKANPALVQATLARLERELGLKPASPADIREGGASGETGL